MTISKHIGLTGFFSLAISLAIFAQPISLSTNTNSLVSRQPDSRGWTDPALNHNKLLQQQTGEGAYKLIGTFKVKGSSYLFGPRHKANVFSKDEKAWNIYINYNTYNQEVEFYSTSNPDMPLVKEPGTLDSFVIQADTSADILTPLKFVYGPILGTNDKSYYEEVAPGSRFTLYKRYKSDLAYESDNYIQSELRVFDLQYDYYYYDNQTKTLKKLKKNTSSITKEFKSVKDVSALANQDEFTLNQERVLISIFASLNAEQKAF